MFARRFLKNLYAVLLFLRDCDRIDIGDRRRGDDPSDDPNKTGRNEIAENGKVAGKEQSGDIQF